MNVGVSITQRFLWLDPEHRAKRRAAIRAAMARPETRARHLDGVRQRFETRTGLPFECRDDYLILRRKVGAKDARRLILSERAGGAS